MISREELLDRRDELMARRDELMERADQIRDDFMEHVDTDTVTMAVGMSLVSGGVAWGLTQVLRGRRGAMGVVWPVGLMALGLVIAGRGAMSRRTAHVQRVREELAELGPIARVQAARGLTTIRMPFVHHN